MDNPQRFVDFYNAQKQQLADQRQAADDDVARAEAHRGELATALEEAVADVEEAVATRDEAIRHEEEFNGKGINALVQELAAQDAAIPPPQRTSQRKSGATSANPTASTSATSSRKGATAAGLGGHSGVSLSIRTPTAEPPTPSTASNTSANHEFKHGKTLHNNFPGVIYDAHFAGGQAVELMCSECDGDITAKQSGAFFKGLAGVTAHYTSEKHVHDNMNDVYAAGYPKKRILSATDVSAIIATGMHKDVPIRPRYKSRKPRAPKHGRDETEAEQTYAPPHKRRGTLSDAEYFAKIKDAFEEDES